MHCGDRDVCGHAKNRSKSILKKCENRFVFLRLEKFYSSSSTHAGALPYFLYAEASSDQSYDMYKQGGCYDAVMMVS